jgi:DNA-directed RNA polymerase specialized sigma24 family protein
VLSLVVGDKLIHLATLHPDATPAELILLMMDGIVAGRLPWKHAEKQTWSQHRRAPAREAISASRHQSTQRAAQPSTTTIDFQRAWAALGAEERRVLQLVSKDPSVTVMAKILDISERAAKERIYQARSHLEELMGGI